MSIRLEMLQVARLAPKLLGPSTELVAAFVRGQQNPNGGFRGRSEKSDLYYTVFGLEALICLNTDLAASQSSGLSPGVHVALKTAESFLVQFGEGEGLDFVHLCCLARCWACMPKLPQQGDRILERLESFRSRDGGYNPIPQSDAGTAYGCFLAVCAYQDLRGKMPDPGGPLRCLGRLKTSDGAWTNEVPAPGPGAANPAPPAKVGATNATAAAVTLLRNLCQPMEPQAGPWLLTQAHPQGGFLAVPKAPLPDLLSTATALHALSGLQCSIEAIREPCLDFVDSLWTNEGGFYGHWHDEYLDCEYTYYGLLALGHLT